MVSSAGAHARQIAHYAGALASLPAELAGHVHERPALPAVLTRVTAALDGAPELSARLAEIWTGLPRVDRRRSMMYVAHGPSSDADAARWLDDLRRAIAPTAAAAGVPFDVGLLRDDAEPAIRAAAVEDSRTKILALAAETGDSVTVLPVLVSTGRIATATIPRDLVGLPIRYVPTPLTPSAHIARWIERVALARAEAPQ
jgi:hypothetical protein